MRRQADVMLCYYIIFPAGPCMSLRSSAPLRIALLLCLAVSAGARAGSAPLVVVSIAPLHALVSGVMDGVGSPQLLLRGNQSPHAFSLRPSEARLLHRAQLLFWIDPALEMPIARMLPALSTTRAVAMLDLAGIERLPLRELHAHDDHAHSERHPPDPHIWLSPGNAMVMSDAIAGVLSETDPDNAPRYRANAAAQRARLQALDVDLRRQLTRPGAAYAVFHDAYQYLEQRYGLAPAATVSTHPERSQSAAHLRQLRRRLDEHGVRCLFSEPQFDARLVERLSDGLAIRHAVLDPLGSEVAPGPHAYEQTLRAIADTLAACVHGDPP